MPSHARILLNISFLFLSTLAVPSAAANTCGFHWPWSQPQSFAFPAGINRFDVKNASLPNGGAKGDGVTDDWLAIQTAFNESETLQLIYFPAGVYMVSQPLTFPRNGAGVTSRRTVHGESVQNTCIRAFDAAPVFGNLSAPKAVIHLGEGVAQNFFNGIMSITVSTGSENPGAIGVQYDANNVGSMRNVSIVTEDGLGLKGLDMQFSDQIGPLLIKWLYVYGFDIGVGTATNVDSETLEHIWLTNQRTAGFSNTGQVVSIRDLTVEIFQQTCIPVVQTSAEANDAALTLIESTLINFVSGVEVLTAISVKSSMAHLRDVSTSGFTYSLMYVGGTAPPPPPSTCVNVTIFNDTGCSGAQIAEITGVTMDECCVRCLDTPAAPVEIGGVPGPCLGWSYIAATANSTSACFLRNSTGTYTRPNTTTGIVNVTSSALAIAPGAGSENLTTSYILEWVSHPIVKLWDDGTTPDASLNLTVMETPEPPLQDASLWVNALGSLVNNSYYNCSRHEVKKNGTSSWAPDCAPLFQAAMANSAANTLYFPPMHYYPFTWFFTANVTIPRTVERIVARGAQYIGTGSWIIEDGDETDPPLIIEGFAADYGPSLSIVQASRRTVVLKDMDGHFMTDCSIPGKLGDVYIDDGVFPPLQFCGGQHVWARQLDTENTAMDVSITGGATVWVLGFKTERGEGGLINVTDSTLEVLGNFAYSTDNAYKDVPLFTVTNASASVSLREYNANCKPFHSLAAETRGDVTRTLASNVSVPGVIPGHACANGTQGVGFTLLNAYSIKSEL